MCLNENSNKIRQEIMKIKCFNLDCSDNWKINQKQIINKRDICFDNSYNNILFNYEYHGVYYENCINGNLANNSTIKYCKCSIEDEKCLYCSNNPIVNNNICIECNHDNGYYEKEDDIVNENKECYKEPIGYYLDMDVSLYKKCYDSCKTCQIEGNNIAHNCLECSDDYPLKIQIYNNYSNDVNFF